VYEQKIATCRFVGNLTEAETGEEKKRKERKSSRR
jgi:hypothetical protein